MTIARIRAAWTVLAGRARAVPNREWGQWALAGLGLQVADAKIDEQIRFLEQARADLVYLRDVDHDARELISARILDAIHDIDVALGRKIAPTKASARAKAAR